MAQCRIDAPALLPAGPSRYRPLSATGGRAMSTASATAAPIATVRDLVKIFSVQNDKGGAPLQLHAVNQVGFDIFAGETLGLVGESGSGKSTIGRLLVGLIPPTNGRHRSVRRTHRRQGRATAIFVGFAAGCNSCFRTRTARSIRACASTIALPSRSISRAACRARTRADRVLELLEIVGLPRSSADRYPHEFSGGQRQRIGIARALALRPEFIVCDEPVSALDVSMQAQIVNLLLDLQDRFGLSYLFIAHDLAVVRSIARRVAVMYAGSIVEQGPKGEIYRAPKHPYTQALLDAVPRPDPERQRKPTLSGEIPSILNPLPGCAFAVRCPLAIDRCRIGAADAARNRARTSRRLPSGIALSNPDAYDDPLQQQESQKTPERPSDRNIRQDQSSRPSPRL